jgi:hypothetical protein
MTYSGKCFYLNIFIRLFKSARYTEGITENLVIITEQDINPLTPNDI